YHGEGEGAPSPLQGPAAMPGPAPSTQATPNQQNGAPAAAQLHFDPATASIKARDSTTVGLSVANVNDLSSIPPLIHYDPAVLQVEDVRDGGFLSGGDQGIAIVHSINQQRGEVIISATRKPNTPGVNGSGTLLGLVVKGLAPGNSALQVLQ